MEIEGEKSTGNKKYTCIEWFNIRTVFSGFPVPFLLCWLWSRSWTKLLHHAGCLTFILLESSWTHLSVFILLIVNETNRRPETFLHI